MKKPIVLSVIMAIMLLAWSFFAPAHAQDSAKEEKPTFYRLIPGVYVNGFPRFTITYPKDWVEGRPLVSEVFSAGPPPPASRGGLTVCILGKPHPIDKIAEIVIVPYFRTVAQDVTVVSNKQSQLRDGTPAQEVELQMILNGAPLNMLYLATKMGGSLILTGGGSSGKIGEDRRAMVYSLQYEPGKDEPVKVPPDIEEFLDRWRGNIISHDMAKVMAHYSDSYLNSGIRKGGVERFQRQNIGSITSFEVGITDFVPAGDRAYLTGFVINNFGKWPITDTSIIKENGEWKWYGNQRATDVTH